MIQPRLVEVSAKDPMLLLLKYETGERKLFDTAPYATGSWFGMLRDPVYFRRVRMLPGGSGIEWPEGQDIAPHELYDLSVDVEPGQP